MQSQLSPGKIASTTLSLAVPEVGIAQTAIDLSQTKPGKKITHSLAYMKAAVPIPGIVVGPIQFVIQIGVLIFAIIFFAVLLQIGFFWSALLGYVLMVIAGAQWSIWEMDETYKGLKYFGLV